MAIFLLFGVRNKWTGSLTGSMVSYEEKKLKMIEFVLCILGIVVLGYIIGWENLSFGPS